jgi:hypothetical protein
VSTFSGTHHKGAMKERKRQKRCLAMGKYKCWVCEFPLAGSSNTIWMLPSYIRKGSPQSPVPMHTDCRGVDKVIANKVLIPNAWDMDKNTFKKHFELRHSDSLGGLISLLPNFDDEMYGSFHDRLHAIRIDLDHEHKDSKS